MSSTAEIMAEIKALSVHYPSRQLSAADKVRWFEDYANDLGSAGFDESDIRIACANWRTSPEKRMPTPGQMLEYCRKLHASRPAPAKIEALPPRPRPSPQERESVRLGLLRLGEQLRSIGGIDFRQLSLQPGETPVDQARRLWPSREVRRHQQPVLDDIF